MKKAYISGEPVQKRKASPLMLTFLGITCICLALAVVFTVFGIKATNDLPEKFYLKSTASEYTLIDSVDEDMFEDSDTVKLTYMSPDFSDCYATVEYTEESWAEAQTNSTSHILSCYTYGTAPEGEEGIYFGFDHEPTNAELVAAVREHNTDEHSEYYGAGMALLFVAVAFAVMTFRGDFFSTYEKVWFLVVITLASIVSVAAPEEEINGINGLLIMLLYLLDTFLNILCELLISKQSKWNFIVSVFVELTEIAVCIALSYRFATLATTLFFWLPCDIISFINWHRHPDKLDDEITVVRTLKGWQEALIIAGVVVWTVGVGYILTRIDLGTTLFGGNEILETVVCYIDACASAVGVVNGIFILLRMREQWIAWFICAILEAAINIISGQYVLIVLKLGYLTNSTYGYLKWTKYIKDKQKKSEGNKHKRVKS